MEFIQSDWDWAGLCIKPGLASVRDAVAPMGPLDCAHRTVSEMLSEAFDYLAERDGQTFDLVGLRVGVGFGRVFWTLGRRIALPLSVPERKKV